MNTVADALCRNLASQISAHGGIDEFRAYALRKLHLRTVIKESHCSPIHQLCFNATSPKLHNLFVTVGKNQLTVYDDVHMGDHTAVVAQFVNAKTNYTAGGELSTCAWLNVQGISPHPLGDACVAVAGVDLSIQVISVAEARVIAMLKGHTAEVVDLSASPQLPGLLLSLARDGTMRMWDVFNQKCLHTVETDAFTAEISLDGQTIVTGHKGGRLYQWGFHVASQAVRQASAALPWGVSPQCLVLHAADLGPKPVLLQLPGALTDTVDCIRFLPGGRLAAKSCDGRIAVWTLADKVQQATWRVPGANALASHKGRCAFGHTPDGSYICAGNNSGQVFVHSTAGGARVTQVSAIRVTGSVRACALSDDCRHLLAVVGNGYIFRFECVRPEDKAAAATEAGTSQEEGAGIASTTGRDSDDDDVRDDGSGPTTDGVGPASRRPAAKRPLAARSPSQEQAAGVSDIDGVATGMVHGCSTKQAELEGGEGGPHCAKAIRRQGSSGSEQDEDGGTMHDG